MSMHCKEVAAALATGGAIRRWRAAAARRPLPAAALTREELRQVAAALADVPPLTAASTALGRGRRGRGPGRADAAMAVPAGPGWGAGRGGHGRNCRLVALCPVDLRQGPPVVADVDASAVKQEALRDVEGLRGSVVGLAQELDDLRRRAELLDARKDVDALIARLDTRGESRGL